MFWLDSEDTFNVTTERAKRMASSYWWRFKENNISKGDCKITLFEVTAEVFPGRDSYSLYILPFQVCFVKKTEKIIKDIIKLCVGGSLPSFL